MSDTTTESRAAHGSRARYQAGCTEGVDDDACDPCTAANTRYVAERRAARADGRAAHASATPKLTKQIGLAVDLDVHELLTRWAAEASDRERRHVTVTEQARAMLTRGVRDKARREARRRAPHDTGDRQ